MSQVHEEVKVLNGTTADAEQTCMTCGKATDKACSGCRLVHYCSREHQKLHWKTHKIDCIPIELQENEDLGRHYVASRDLAAGKWILEEDPLVAGPTTGLCKLRGFEEEKAISCLACCRVVLLSLAHRCSTCTWPLCSTHCETVFHHAENECKLFSQQATVFSDHLFYLCKKILVVRACLLKKKNPRAWRKVLKLQHKFALPTIGDTAVKVDGTVEAQSIQSQDWTTLAKKMNELKGLKLEKVISLEDWIRVSNAVEINARQRSLDAVIVPESTPSPSDVRNWTKSILAARASMFANSCAPNCCYEISQTFQFQMRVRTAVDIKKGDMLTIAYYSEVPEASGTVQRACLMNDFLCKCIRCKDPFELGTNYSTWICQHCKGPVICTNPLERGADWKCTACGSITSANAILTLLMMMQKYVQSAHTRTDTVDVLQKFIEKFTITDVHPNHSIVAMAHNGIFQHFIDARTRRNLTQEERNTFIASGEFLGSVFEKIFPGLSRERANLQNMMCEEMLRMATNNFRQNLVPITEFIRQLLKIKRLDNMTYNILKMDRKETCVGEFSIHMEPIKLRLMLVKEMLDKLFVKNE